MPVLILEEIKNLNIEYEGSAKDRMDYHNANIQFILDNLDKILTMPIVLRKTSNGFIVEEVTLQQKRLFNFIKSDKFNKLDETKKDIILYSEIEVIMK